MSLTPLEELCFLLTSEPRYGSGLPSGMNGSVIQWKMLDECITRHGVALLDQYHDEILLKAKGPNDIPANDNGVMWLWSNLTPTQSMRVEGRGFQANAFEKDPILFKKLCQSLTLSFPDKGQNPAYQRQLTLLRYSMEMNHEPYNDKGREVSEEDIKYLSEFMYQAAEHEQKIVNIFTTLLLSSHRPMNTDWLTKVLAYTSKKYQNSQLHDQLSSYLLPKATSNVVSLPNLTGTTIPHCSNILSLSSENTLKDFKHDWTYAVQPHVWVSLFTSFKNSTLPQSVWEKYLPKDHDVLHISQWAMRQEYALGHPSIMMLATYPFDEDQDGLSKARVAVPAIQKDLLYLMISSPKRASRLGQLKELSQAVASSKILSSLFKEDMISAVQWGVWHTYGGSYFNPNKDELDGIRELRDHPDFQKALSLCPPLMKGTIENIYNQMLGEETTSPMLRMAALRKDPGGSYTNWNSLFMKHSIEKELSKTKKRRQKIETDVVATPKRRM